MRRFPYITSGALAASILLSSALAGAQTPPEATPPLTAVQPQPQIVTLEPDAPGAPGSGGGESAGAGGAVGYQHGRGFFVHTPDDRYVLTLAGRLQTDLRVFPALGGDDPPESGLHFRRARLELAGTVLRCVHWALSFDLASGEQPVDAFLHWVPTSRLRLWAGRFVTPFGLERQWSSVGLPFMERSVALSTLGPGYRRLGAMVDWQLDNELLYVALGVFQASEPAAEDGRTILRDIDGMARVFVTPFRGDATLHVGVAGVLGRRAGDGQPNVLSGKTMFEHSWFGGIRADGLELRLGAELDFRWNRFRLSGEGFYARIDQAPIADRGTTAEVDDPATGLGATATLSVMLLGESPSRKATRGISHVDLATGHARIREIGGEEVPWSLELALGLDWTRLDVGYELDGMGGILRGEPEYTSGRFAINLGREHWLRFSLQYAVGAFGDVATHALTDSDLVHELGVRSQVAF